MEPFLEPQSLALYALSYVVAYAMMVFGMLKLWPNESGRRITLGDAAVFAVFSIAGPLALAVMVLLFLWYLMSLIPWDTEIIRNGRGRS